MSPKSGMQINPLFQKTDKKALKDKSPQSVMQVKHPNGRTEIQKDVKTAIRKNIKCTYHFSPDTVKRIDTLRYLLSTKFDKKMTLSRLIEIAIKIADLDLEKKQQESLLIKGY